MSRTPPEAVEIAAALSRHARQGRDLRFAVIDWFAEAGLNAPGSVPVPEPPDAAVQDAVVWIIGTSLAHRLLRLAGSARTEAEQDDFYRAAGDAVGRVSAPLVFDAVAVRDALLTGADPGDGLLQIGAADARAGLIHLTAAIGMGIDEVGSDALSEALANSGTFPSMSADGLADALADFERSGETGNAVISLGQRDPLVVTFGRYDLLALAQLANADHLRRAREVLYGLAGMGALYMSYGLLMPDTPGLAALRARIDELGIGQMLIFIFMSVDNTGLFVINLLSCIHPVYQAFRQLLVGQFANGRSLLSDKNRSAEEFMADWLAAIKART